RFLKLLVKSLSCARNFHISPKLLTDGFDLVHSLCKTFCVSSHTHFIPHYFSKFFMEVVNRILTVVAHKEVYLLFYFSLCLIKLRSVCRYSARTDFFR